MDYEALFGNPLSRPMDAQDHEDLRGKAYLSEATLRAVLYRVTKHEDRKKNEGVNAIALDPGFLNHYEITQPLESRQLLAGTAPPAGKPFGEQYEAVVMPFCIVPTQTKKSVYNDLNGHWIVVFLNFDERQWAVFDSADTFQPASKLHHRVAVLIKELTGMWDGPGWKYAHLPVPLQDDAFNCGVHTIENVRTVLGGNKPPDPAVPGHATFDPKKQRAFYAHVVKDQ